MAGPEKVAFSTGLINATAREHASVRLGKGKHAAHVRQIATEANFLVA